MKTDPSSSINTLIIRIWHDKSIHDRWVAVKHFYFPINNQTNSDFKLWCEVLFAAASWFIKLMKLLKYMKSFFQWLNIEKFSIHWTQQEILQDDLLLRRHHHWSIEGLIGSFVFWRSRLSALTVSCCVQLRFSQSSFQLSAGFNNWVQCLNAEDPLLEQETGSVLLIIIYRRAAVQQQSLKSFVSRHIGLIRWDVSASPQALRRMKNLVLSAGPERVRTLEEALHISPTPFTRICGFDLSEVKAKEQINKTSLQNQTQVQTDLHSTSRSTRKLAAAQSEWICF